MRIPHVFSTDCNNKDCFNKNHTAKWYANTNNKIAGNNYIRFMSAKLEYSRKDLLKWVLPEYYSIIYILIKSKINIVAEHKEKWSKNINL